MAWAANLSFVILSVLGALFWPREHVESVSPMETPAAVDSTVALSEPPRSERHDSASEEVGQGSLKPGDVLRFDFDVERDVEVTFTAEAAGQPQSHTADLRAALTGVLTLKVYENTGADYTIGCEVALTKRELRSSGSETLPATPDEISEMAGEVLVRMKRSGEIESLSFLEGTTVEGRNSWRELLALWQVILPDDGAVTEWETTEEDTTGEYVARYSRRRKGALTEITKEKRSYESVRSIDQSGRVETLNAETLVDGRTVIVLDPLPLRIDGRETLEIRPELVIESSVSTAVYHFERRERTFDPNLPRVFPRKQLTSARATGLGNGEVSRSPAARRLDGVEVEGLLAEAHSLLSSVGLESTEIAGYMARLIEQMKQDRRVVEAVMEELRGGKVDDDVAALFIGALGHAGTREAQEGLQEIFADTGWSRPRRESALIAFARVETPRAEGDDLLLDLYEEGGELSSTALLVLSAVGSRVKDSEPSRSEMIDSYVRDNLLGPGRDNQTRITGLEALGNLGPEITPPEVEVALLDEDQDVRAAALSALRRTPDPTASVLIVHALRNDPVETVRAAAIDAFTAGERTSAKEILGEALLADDSDFVRRRALSRLSVLPESDAVELATWTSLHDRSPEVRALAREMLRSGDHDGSP